MTLTYPRWACEPRALASLTCPIKYSTRSGRLHTCIHDLNYSDSKLWPKQYCQGRKRRKGVTCSPIHSFFFSRFKVNAVTNATDARTGPDTNSPTSSMLYKYGRFHLYTFTPRLKLHLLLPVPAKGYTVSALERGARGRDSGMSGLSLPRCHFLSGPPPAPPHCRRRSPLAWPWTLGSAAAGPPSVDPGPSPSGRA